MEIRVGGLGDSKAFVEVKETEYGLEFGVGYSNPSGERELATYLAPWELDAIAKMLETFVLTQQDNEEGDDED